METSRRQYYFRVLALGVSILVRMIQEVEHHFRDTSATGLDLIHDEL